MAFPLGGTNQLHQRDLRRAGVGTGAALDAIAQAVRAQRIETARPGQASQPGWIQKVRTGRQTPSTADTGKFIGGMTLFFREREDAGGPLEDGHIKAADGLAHHGSAHDDASGGLPEPAAEPEHLPERGSDGHDEIRRIRDAGTGHGHDAFDEWQAGIEIVGDGHQGTDVVDRHPDIPWQFRRGQLITEDRLDQHPFRALGIFHRQWHDVDAVDTPDAFPQNINGPGFILLNADDGPLRPELALDDGNPSKQGIRALQHQAVIVGEIRLAFGAVDQQIFDLFPFRHAVLHVARKGRAPQSHDAGPLDVLDEFVQGQRDPIDGRIGGQALGGEGIGVDLNGGREFSTRRAARLNGHHLPGDRTVERGGDEAARLSDALPSLHALPHADHRLGRGAKMLIQR